VPSVTCSLFGLFCLLLQSATTVRADTPATAPANEIEQALKDLKKADADGRAKIYTLLGDKGDASLIPALNAYKDGSLQLTDKQELAIYGDRVTLPDQGSVLPAAGCADPQSRCWETMGSRSISPNLICLTPCARRRAGNAAHQ